MSVSGAARIALMVVLCAGSTALGRAGAGTSPREDPVTEIPVDRLTLRDVHPLFGGRNLYLDRRGRGILQVVERASGEARLRDHRYRVELSRASAEAIAAVLAARDFLRGAPPASRAGIPDESRISLQLVVTPDEVVTVRKWSGQTHEAFDAVYQALLGLIPDLIRRGRVAEEVPYDPRWVPEGFGRS